MATSASIAEAIHGNQRRMPRQSYHGKCHGNTRQLPRHFTAIAPAISTDVNSAAIRGNCHGNFRGKQRQFFTAISKAKHGIPRPFAAIATAISALRGNRRYYQRQLLPQINGNCHVNRQQFPL